MMMLMMLMIDWPNESLELSNFVLQRETFGFGLERCRNGRNNDDDDNDDDDGDDDNDGYDDDDDDDDDDDADE